MDASARNEIERACERLVMTYTHLVDFGEAEKIADLFTEDGEFNGGGANRMKGKDQLKKGFGRRQRSKRVSRHVCTNLKVDVLDENNAKGLVYLSLYRHDPEEGENSLAPLAGPSLIGQYEDTFRRENGQWLFAERKIGVKFIAKAEGKS